MRWATRDHVHMDRVATPWLIRRFIDEDATFEFVPFGQDDAEIPEGAIAVAIPGAEIGIHDDEGSTFRKVMVKYDLADPALERMARVIESGIHHVFNHKRPDYSPADLEYPEGIGLDALAHGMMYATPDDTRNIEASLIIYDGLYQYCRFLELVANEPEILDIPVPAYWDTISARLAADG